MDQTKLPVKKPVQTILWWIIWISATIISFFISAAVWTPIIANKFGSIHETQAGIFWVVAVFGTWMVFLVPMIVFMYQKVDRAYEDARNARERKAAQFRSLNISVEKRTLSEELQKKMQDVPEAINGGHLVTVKLKNGQALENVFIQNRSEILGIYDVKEMTFETKDILDIQPTNLDQLPQFNPNRWLRLDGVTLPD